MSHQLLGAARVQGYSDAVLSIIATVLVVPLTKLSESARREIFGFLNPRTLYEVLTSNYQVESYFMYWATFSLVFIVWIWHGRQFHGIEKVNQVLVGANWLELLFTATLPFTAGNAAHASSAAKKQHERYQLEFPFYLNVVLITSSHLLFQVIAGFKRNDVKLSRYLLVEAVLDCAISIGAMVLQSHRPRYAFLLLVIIPLTAFVTRAITYPRRVSAYTRRGSGSSYGSIETSAEGNQHERNLNSRTPLLDTGASNQFGRFMETVHGSIPFIEVDLSRLEVFTDGVIAITVTLLVLDLQPVPACDEIKSTEACLMHARDGCRPHPLAGDCMFDAEEWYKKLRLILVGFIFSFVLANQLWSQHHFIFDRFKRGRKLVSNVGLIINLHFCFFISLIPMCFNLVSDYVISPPNHYQDNENVILTLSALHADKRAGETAISVTCVVLFLASGTLFLLLAYVNLELDHFERMDTVVWIRFSVMPVLSTLNILLIGVLGPGVSFYPLVSIPIVLIVIDLLDTYAKPKIADRGTIESGN